MLVISQFTDLYWFIVHAYKWQIQRVSEKSNYPRISLSAFNKFYNMIDQLEGTHHNAKDIVIRSRKLFKTSECIFGVMYSNTQIDQLDVKHGGASKIHLRNQVGEETKIGLT